jgi:hypothetical protein
MRVKAVATTRAPEIAASTSLFSSMRDRIAAEREFGGSRAAAS